MLHCLCQPEGGMDGRMAEHGSKLVAWVSLPAGIRTVALCIDVHWVAMLSCKIVISMVVCIVVPGQVKLVRGTVMGVGRVQCVR